MRFRWAALLAVLALALTPQLGSAQGTASGQAKRPVVTLKQNYQSLEGTVASRSDPDLNPEGPETLVAGARLFLLRAETELEARRDPGRSLRRGLEQGRLSLWRSPIDLVGQKNMGEDGPL